MKKNSAYTILIYLTFCFSNSIQDISQSSTFYDRENSSTIKVIESDINHTVLEILINDYKLDEIDDNKYLIRIDDAVLSLSKGNPNLPKLNTSIIIPDQANMEISILDFDYEEINNIDILPSKGNISRSIEPSSVPYTYSNIYKEDSFYPESLADLGEPYILRGLRGQGVSINVVQFNPISQKIRVYNKIVIEISKSNLLNKKVKNSIVRREGGVKTSTEFKEIYKNLFINYPSDLRFNYLSDQGNMLIICYDDFINEMEPFVSWKNKKGISTEIAPLSTVGNSVEDIQEYINTYYYQNGLTYLLLVGDSAQMPTHIVDGSASDPTYGFIEGDDAFSEIIVGRFSANNPSQVAIQVQKTLEYEQNPSVEFDHFNKALGIGSDQGPGYGGLSDNEFQDLLWNDFLDDYTYQSFQGVYDGAGSLSEGMDAINSGVGIINYTGHAGPNGWGNGAPLSSSDVNDLTNTDKLPFIFTVGCNPGQFNDYTECFCESWMWATDDDGNPTGAVGHLGSTISQSWEPPMHGQWAMNAILTESYENNISRSYGGIAVNGCMHMNEAQGSSGINETKFWTLFGDPSLIVRTDVPVELNVSHSESIIIGQQELVVDVGIDGALVALSIDNELRSYAYSNGGVAILDLDSVNTIPGQVIDIVVSSFNAYPYQSIIQVLGSEGAYLLYNNYELINNNNGIIEYGQLVEMNLLIENIGTLNTSAINLEVSTDSEYINMLDNTSILAYAISGQVSTTENPISFAVAGNAPDGHSAHFIVNMNNGDQDWNSSFNIEISAPNFEIGIPTIVDENMDGVWDAGETATIYVDLINSGSAGYGWYPGAVITTDNPYINILSSDSANTFYGIDGNSAYQGSFVVESDESTPLSTEVEFMVSWGYSTTAPCEEDCLEQAYLSYSSTVGHPSMLIWDPSSQHISGNKLVAYCNDNNITGFDYLDTQDLTSLDNYKTIFVFLGIYPENHILQEINATILAEFLSSGGDIYMEGGDTWAFDSQTSLQPMFGLLAEADGSADLLAISGVDNTFTEGLSFGYEGGNNFIDRILPSGGFSIMSNSDPEYTTSIAYENIPVGYRTIASSHELGGLTGDDLNLYISSLLQFLNEGYDNNLECIPGDLNQDGIVDVTDIIRHVNIIMNELQNPSDVELCASDLNSDDAIDVLDVIAMINIILDRRNIISHRLQFTDNIEIENAANKLSIKTDGSVRGIEFFIESDASRLNLNDNLNMDISYNISDNQHHVLFYSLNGYVLEPGNHKLFESNNSYKIIDFKVSNSNNDLVQINYLNESIPSAFILKQNYPNPFNPVTSIEIDILNADNITLTIYDINGREVKLLAQGSYQPGNYKFSWDSLDDLGQKLSSGIYIYQLKTSDNISTKKMLLLK